MLEAVEADRPCNAQKRERARAADQRSRVDRTRPFDKPG